MPMALPRPGPRSRLRRECGSVLVYALAMLLVVALVVTMVFNTGQLTAEKIKLHNTADAVAFSVATVEARNLNFLSYTNRAILANHASMAQMASFLSLTRMGDVTVGTMQETLQALNLLDWVPGLGEVIVALTEAMTVLKNVFDVLTGALKLAIEVAVQATWLLEQAIYASQLAMQVSTVDSLVETYTQVLAANDSTAHWSAPAGVASVAVAAAEAGLFTKAYVRPGSKQDEDSDPTTKDYKRATKVMEDLRDDFTKRRVIFPVFDAIKAFLPLSINGGTELQQFSDGSFGWDALDTLSLRLPSDPITWVFGNFPIHVPLGGGAVQVGNSEKTTFMGEPAKLVTLAADYLVDPLGEKANKDYEKQLAKYGGQKWKPAVKAWWPNGLGKTIVSEKEQIDGALVEDPITALMTLESVPGTSFQGIETVASNAKLPYSYFDVRTIGQTYTDCTDFSDKSDCTDENRNNSKALDLVDRLDGPMNLLKPGIFDPNSDLGPSVLVPLSKHARSLHTSTSLGMDVERAALPDARELRVLSKGQVYFQRPADRWPRKDLAIEHRNLFDPYWNARLAHPKLWERNLDILLPD